MLRTDSTTIPVVIVGLAVAAFHLNFPLSLSILGRHKLFISLEFVAVLPVLWYALAGIRLMIGHRRGRWSLWLFISLVFWTFLGLCFAPQTARAAVTYLGLLLLMCGSAFLFFRHGEDILKNLPAIVLAVVVCFLVWLAVVASTGPVESNPLDSSGQVMRYTVGDVLPTELSILLGVQVCYLLYLWKAHPRLWLLAPSLIGVNLVLMLRVAGSRGAVAAMALIVLMYVMEGGFPRMIRAVGVSAIVLFFAAGAVLPFYDSIATKMEATRKGDEREVGRLVLYRVLWEIALAHPWFGIGSAQFLAKGNSDLVPHQNILGVATEKGLPAAVIYALFLVAATGALCKRQIARQESVPGYRATAFIRACLWILMYYQFRGLFTDTATYKEIAFVVGAGIGLRISMESRSAPRELDNGRPRVVAHPRLRLMGRKR